MNKEWITKEDIQHQIDDLTLNAELKDKDTGGTLGLEHIVRIALIDLANWFQHHLHTPQTMEQVQPLTEEQIREWWEHSANIPDVDMLITFQKHLFGVSKEPKQSITEDKYERYTVVDENNEIQHYLREKPRQQPHSDQAMNDPTLDPYSPHVAWITSQKVYEAKAKEPERSCKTCKHETWSAQCSSCLDNHSKWDPEAKEPTAVIDKMATTEIVKNNKEIKIRLNTPDCSSNVRSYSND